MAKPWLGHGPPTYLPFMEAATAADLTSAPKPGLRRPRQRPTKRGVWGAEPPQQKPDLTLTCMRRHVLGSALSHDPVKVWPKQMRNLGRVGPGPIDEGEGYGWSGLANEIEKSGPALHGQLLADVAHRNLTRDVPGLLVDFSCACQAMHPWACSQKKCAALAKECSRDKI